MSFRGGVHPLILRRHAATRGRRPSGEHSDFFVSVAGVMLFLASCALGLRWVDKAHAATQDEPTPISAPADKSDYGLGSTLSSVFRASFGIRTAEAAGPIGPYWGAPVQKTVSVTAAPGELVPVEIRFRNTGSVAWTPEGRRFISAYTIKPRYHASVFRSTDWMSSGQPAKLATSRVRFGEEGTLRMTLTAPMKAGTYSDVFQLASEDTSWIWGAYVTVKMKVTGTNPKPQTPNPTQATNPVQAAEPVPAPKPLSGMLVQRTAERIEAPGGLDMTIRFVIKNTGDATWKAPGLRLVSAKAADGSAIDISNDGWASPELAVVKNELIAKNQNADLFLTIVTPPKKGTYALRFMLVADGATLDSIPLDIPITVTSDAPVILPQDPVTTAPQGEPAAQPISSNGEPMIRVGLFTTDKQEELTSDGAFEVRDTKDAVLARYGANARVKFWYDLSSRVYRAYGGGADISSALPIRFIQTGSSLIFTLTSYEHRPAWNTSLNDNRFRGVMELRKNDRNDYVWLIDELPMETYLRGMGETSNASPLEFQKALAVAARTYAYWHWSHPGKHWHFTVDAAYDQVYLGYGAEIRLPRWVSAIEATRAQVVTYGGNPVVTPYYTWSDGRTRSWTEVWGGADKPWLRSVACVYDLAASRTLFGHGVGMSAWDAIGKANSGEMYDAILRYYYSGTGLKSVY